MSANIDLESELRLNKEHRLLILKLVNKILQVRLKRLNSLNDFYKDYLLESDLKYYKAKQDWLSAKKKFSKYQTISDEVDKKLQNFEKEYMKLNQDLEVASNKLEPFKRLDPAILAEYRELKDDLECQDMLIQIGAGNNLEC